MSAGRSCCLCGEPGTHPVHARFSSVRHEGSTRVTTYRTAGAVVCDACEADVRGHWRRRRLAAVGFLAAVFGMLFGSIGLTSAFPDLPGPFRGVVFVAVLGFIVALTIAGTVRLRDARKELHDRVAEGFDVDVIYGDVERAGGAGAGISFELQLGVGEPGDPRLEDLAPEIRRRRQSQRTGRSPGKRTRGDDR